MREALQKPRTLYFLVFGVLVAMVVFGYSQNEGV